MTFEEVMKKMDNVPFAGLTEKEKAAAIELVSGKYEDLDAALNAIDLAWVEGRISYAGAEAAAAKITTRSKGRTYWYSWATRSLWLANKIISSNKYGFRHLRNACVYEIIENGESIEEVAFDMRLDEATVEYYYRYGRSIMERYKDVEGPSEEEFNKVVVRILAH